MLRDLQAKAKLEETPEAERPTKKAQKERVQAVVQAQLDKNSREKQSRERADRDRNSPRPGRG